MKLISGLLIALIISFQIVNAQSATIEHTVVKGETVYGISKKYNVTVNDVYKLNPSSTNGISIGQTLIIPQSDASNNNSVYIVKRGETKFGLSKKFGIPINELERQNPHITAGLQTGHRLQIDNTNSTPSSNTSVEKTSANTTAAGSAQSTSYANDSSYRTHKVLKGETLYGISRANGITVDELKSSNSEVLSGILRTGTVLKIPNSNGAIATTPEPVPVNTTANGTYRVKKGDTKFGLSKKYNVSIAQLEASNPEIVDMLRVGTLISIPDSDVVTNNTTDSSERTISQVQEPEIKEEELKNTTPNIATESGIINLRSSLNYAVKKNILYITPYTDSELIASDDNSISDLQLKHYVEFYNGVKMAIDSAKILGINFDLNVETTTGLSNRLKVGNSDSEFKDYNVVISPFKPYETEQFAMAALRSNIPVVTTTAKQESRSLVNLFEAFPSFADKQITMMNYLKDKEQNIIVLNDPEKLKTEELIQNITPEAKFVKLTKRGTFKDETLYNSLEKDKTNYVIINSDKNRVFLNATNLLLSESTNYKIQLVVLDENLIPSEAYVSAKRYKVLNMIYPAPANIDNAGRADQLERKYSRLYKSTPETDYAMYGFDIMFDTILRVCQDDGFEKSAKSEVTSYTLLNFEYKQNELERFSNNKVSILEYNSDSAPR